MYQEVDGGGWGSGDTQQCLYCIVPHRCRKEYLMEVWFIMCTYWLCICTLARAHLRFLTCPSHGEVVSSKYNLHLHCVVLSSLPCIKKKSLHKYINEIHCSKYSRFPFLYYLDPEICFMGPQPKLHQFQLQILGSTIYHERNLNMSLHR